MSAFDGADQIKLTSERGDDAETRVGDEHVMFDQGKKMRHDVAI